MFSIKELMKYKLERALRNAGKIRQEGKNYIVQDEDVVF